MGNSAIRAADAVTKRQDAVTGGGGQKAGPPKLPSCAMEASAKDCIFLEGALSKLLIFNSMDNQSQRMLVQNMYKRHVTAGEILIDQGSTGLAATQLYVIESGSFEILQKRQGYTVRVNLDDPGRCLGEISLYYDWARNAAIVAKSRAVVWVLDRYVFRSIIQKTRMASLPSP
ncbi:cyclic nucleotide-binding-like protein [Haematococcus lacustris]